MLVLTILFSLCSLIAGNGLTESAPPASLYAPPTPIIAPLPAYGPPAPPVPAPVAVYQSPVPAPPPSPAATYGVPGLKIIEEQDLQGGSLPGPENAPGVQSAPGQISLPQNTKVEIHDQSGQYSHGFDQGGTQISEQGKLITTNGGWEYVIAKKGSYSYVSPEGQRITVHYIADHNGYRVLDNPDAESL